MGLWWLPPQSPPHLFLLLHLLDCWFAIAELLVASWRDSDDEDWSCSKEPDAPNHQERSKEVYVPFPL